MQSKSIINTTKEVKGIVLIIGISLCTFLYFCKSVYANPGERLNINAEVEYKVSDFQRDPEPTQSSSGVSLAQKYRLYLEGGMFKQGKINGFLGASLNDVYRKNDTDFENKLRFDYGRALRIETLSKSETDEEIFFSGTVEPQSLIHTITKKYDSRLLISRACSLEYSFENKERKDLLLGTVTGEETETQQVRFNVDTGALTFSAEYREIDFDDKLGTRSDVDSTDLSMEVFYKPRDSFSISGFIEENKDVDIDNDSELKSRDSRVEFSFKPLKEIRIRDGVSLRTDKNSDTGEDITNQSNEIILNFEPNKQIDLELSYKKEEEDKQRDLLDIDSDISEQSIVLRLSPLSQVSIQTGYEVTDKTSTSLSENIKDTKIYSDVSLEPVDSLRLGANFSNTKQKNTFTSLIESDTKSLSGSLQYRPKQKMFLFLQGDSSKTDNPSTGAFTKTDTISSNFNFDPLSFLNVSLRTSAQKTTGTSDSALSKRLLNSVEFNINLLENLKLSTEYELITSSGAVSSDENLFDIAAFYNMGKFDFSLRLQKRDVTGDSPTDKVTILSNIKYRFTKNAVFSFRVSLIDYADEVTSSNSYDSTTIESLLSMRF